MSDSDASRSRMVRAARKAPYLEREEERLLAVRWKDNQDQQALHALTTAHMRLVIAMASRFKNFGLPLTDLIQEGHIGLLEAAARFDPEREVRFSTYATWWIRASMQDYILRNWSIVRGGTSSAQKSLFFNLRRLRARLSSGPEGLAGHQLHQEIGQTLGVATKDVALMDSRLSGPDASLNAPSIESDEGSADRMDMIPCSEALPDENVEQSIDQNRQKNWLNDALQVLNERELRIVRDRRLSEEGATLESLGQTLGISKERVRQIESRALEKLRSQLLKTGQEQSAYI